MFNSLHRLKPHCHEYGDSDYYFNNIFYGISVLSVRRTGECRTPKHTLKIFYDSFGVVVVVIFCILLQPILIPFISPFSEFYLYTSSSFGKCHFLCSRSLGVGWPLHCWMDEWQYGNMWNDRWVSLSPAVERHDTKNRLVSYTKSSTWFIKDAPHSETEKLWCSVPPVRLLSLWAFFRLFLVMLFHY